MSKISTISAREILDSRGDWTIEAKLSLESGFAGSASSPQGKSVGSNAMVCIPASEAVLKVEEDIKNELIGENFESIKELDEFLIKFDGTENKENLGANTMLAISIAFSRALSGERELFLWRLLKEEYADKVNENKTPGIFANLINGGLHAGNELAFQEYLIIPKEQKIKKATEKIILVRERLKNLIEEEFGFGVTGLGDEGGFAPPFTDEEEPLEFLSEAIENAGLEREIDLGIDFAAENIDAPEEDLLHIYEDISRKYNLFYMEDPFAEEEFEWFSELLKNSRAGSLVVGDDLTVTNVERMKEAKERESINSVIIKPNQIGTITETLNALKFAKENDWFRVVSHRSGETGDSFIADLAFAVGADGIKIGAPARGERVAKYNRLLEIEGEYESQK